jgi:hypothetical protein
MQLTILPEKPHGGNYQSREIWNYLEFLEAWIHDHGPNGTQPLSDSVTVASSRGNQWDEVIKRGGRAAAVKRQAAPRIDAGYGIKVGSTVEASVGRWDPGVELEAQWFINGQPVCEKFGVKQGERVEYDVQKAGDLQLLVTGGKRNYATETRQSNCVDVSN